MVYEVWPVPPYWASTEVVAERRPAFAWRGPLRPVASWRPPAPETVSAVVEA